MPHITLKLSGLAAGYDGKAVIRDVDLDIEKGGIITLIGPNGSGKSTLLKTISRQLSAISGNIVYEDMDLGKYSQAELARRMSVMLTDRIKPELMTCRDVVAAGRYPYTGKLGILSAEDEKKVDECLSIVHAEELGDRLFNAISDGQKQRVLLARAFCQEPEVLILDEPTAYLDIRHKLDLLSILKGMARKHEMTVIMSIHEIDLAAKVSDKLLCLKGERVFSSGTPEEIMADGLVRDLYDIDSGYYDSMYGSVELPGPKGEPKVFVLSNCGSGIPVYRKLQRMNIPFAAGVMDTNDPDLRLARLLAVETVHCEPFEEIDSGKIEEAKALMEKCGSVINAGLTIGSTNWKLRELEEYAEKYRSPLDL